MKKPIRGIAFWFALAIMASAWGAIGATWSKLLSSYNGVAQSHEALERLQVVQGMMEAAQTSVCTYVITGREDRLSAFRNAQAQVPRKLKEVDTLVAAHPAQKKPMKQLRRLIFNHLEYMSGVVQLRESGGFDTAAQWIAAEVDPSDSVRRLMGEVQKAESSEVQELSTSSTERSSKTKNIFFLVAFLSVGVLTWAFSLLGRESGKRYLVESANQRLESCLREIMERIPYLITVKEAANLRLILVNKAATEWLGRSEAELVGSNEFDLRPVDQAREAMQQDRDVLNQGQTIDIPEDHFVRAGSEERLLHTKKIVIPDSTGVPAFLLTISEDITEQKEAERLLKLSRDTAVQSEHLKSEFIRNMSHEIRTPLAIIIGMMSLLLDMELDKEQRHFATKVKIAADGLSRWTKEVLDFSKIESGTFTLEMQDMNIRQTVDGVVAMLGEQAKAKGVGLVTLIPNDLPLTVVSDPIRLRQVLAQLIGNAVKFTSRGEILVRVQATKSDSDQVWLTYKVIDTGVGIETEAQKFLFEPFRQGDGSPTRKFGGTGVGLAMVKRIVELMGGEIGFESVAGQGSTFWFTVPCKKRQALGPAVAVTSLPWAKSRVLVINESEATRNQMRQQLSTWGLASESALSGETALDLMRREERAGRSFAIVILDMHLVDMDSMTFAHQVKAEASLASTQLVVLSESTVDVASMAEFGFAACLPKPPKPEALYERLAALIESNKSNQHAA